MHAKRVAHMDIKSSDVLVDDDKRLWIVDYDLSEILDEVEDGEVVLVSGFRGTKGFTAQEVGRKDYDPLLAECMGSWEYSG